MSFRCQIVGKVSKFGEKVKKLVVATRERNYFKTILNEETRQMEEKFVARGFEIVKELSACDEGAALWNAWSPEQRSLFLTKAGYNT